MAMDYMFSMKVIELLHSSLAVDEAICNHVYNVVNFFLTTTGLQTDLGAGNVDPLQLPAEDSRRHVGFQRIAGFSAGAG